MKIRRKSVVGLVALGLIGGTGSVSLAASETYVGQVVLNQNSYSSGYGGEFSAELTYANPVPPPVGIQSSNAFVQYYAGTNSANNLTAGYAVFETFCIEEGVHDVVFSPGTYYAATIGDTGDNQTLNIGAAYLYDQFWKGTLDHYDFADSVPGGRKASAGALQAAIWILEGDNTMDGTGPGGVGSGAAGDAGITGNAAAIAQAQAWVVEAQGVIPDLRPPVQVLGMYTSYDSNTGVLSGLAQAQLVEIPDLSGTSTSPVPLPASVGIGFSMLGGFGGLFAFRKRMSRRARIA